MDEQQDATTKPELEATEPSPVESGDDRAVVESAGDETSEVHPDVDDIAATAPHVVDEAAPGVASGAAAVAADEPGDAVAPGETTAADDGAVAVSEVAEALGFADSPGDAADQALSDPVNAEPAAPVVDSQLKAIIEALVFASPDPLTVKAITKVLAGEAPEAIDLAVEALKQDYARAGGLQMVEVAGGFQIVTRPDLHEWVRRLFHERTTQKLSVAALETLAVIAYKQPITSAEIADVRGVNTSGVLGTLIDRKLVKITGRKQVVGRPFMYATTREFLNRFGLRDLNDLPKVEDLADALGFEPPLLEDEATTVALPFGDVETAGPGTTASDAVDDVIGEEPPAGE